VHGGALFAFADDLGGTVAGLNVPEGFRTTTIESKSNIFHACPPGRLIGIAVPLHVGRRTMVVQTSIYRSDGSTRSVQQRRNWTTGQSTPHGLPVHAPRLPERARRDRRDGPVIGGHYLKSLAARPPKISALIVAIGSKVPPARGTISRCRRCSAIRVERCPMEMIVVFGRTSISIR
jgi:Thioesterase superfamily